MRITKIECREIAIARRSSFLSSRARVAERRIILVTVYDEHGREGWGECSAPEEPRYCEEWTDSAWLFLNHIAAPRVLGRTITAQNAISDMLGQFRGNRMAMAALENACWDLAARSQQVPLWRLLGGSGQPIPCGVALGIMESIGQLIESVHREVDTGYQRIKLKIGPGWDVEVVKAVRRSFPRVPLMVDANGAYTIADMTILRELDAFGLAMIEQPFAPDDLWAYDQIRGVLQTPLCLDETVTSLDRAIGVIKLGLCNIINVKVGRVGGHSEARAIIEVCKQNGVTPWCGGQHEAGLGRAHNIAVATLMPHSIPSEMSASKRYWDRDIIEPEIQVGQDGYLSPSEHPGCGFVIDRDYVAQLTTQLTVYGH